MNKYRYYDYYGMTKHFDDLFLKAKSGKTFTKLMKLIADEDNIKLAYRMVKANTGSKTAGVDGITIQNLKEKSIEEYVDQVKSKLEYFKPDPVRRVFIPKEYSDKLRPLGIPTMIDRIVQQAILQVLEPICESKFHNHSYGFRPNRGTKHAIARMNYLINQSKFYYAVDIDIKGFFDNVNHNKLIKQLYSLGIADRKLLSITKAMLKAPIVGEGIPTKGTPQGGILSPLLANVVLNELDWWISSQWETQPTKKKYHNESNRYRELKKTKLKQMFLVRYADDFKIMCKSYNDARKILIAVEKWLKERLGLEIQKDKSKIVNLRNHYSEFLGIKITAMKKSDKWVIKSHMKDKTKKRISKKIKQQIIAIQKHPLPENVMRLNTIILGVHNYYNAATMVSKDFHDVAFSVRKSLKNRLKAHGTYGIPKKKNSTYEKFYGESQSKTWTICGIPIYPINYISHQKIMAFSQDICDYTKQGREKSAKALASKTDPRAILLAKRYIKSETVEYNDNRISRASMCKFKCEVTGMELGVNEIHAHHKIPRHLGGTDDYDNLRIVHEDIHRLIHAVKEETIKKYIGYIKDKKMLNKLNALRSFCKLDKIEIV